MYYLYFCYLDGTLIISKSGERKNSQYYDTILERVTRMDLYAYILTNCTNYSVFEDQ